MAPPVRISSLLGRTSSFARTSRQLQLGYCKRWAASKTAICGSPVGRMSGSRPVKVIQPRPQTRWTTTTTTTTATSNDVEAISDARKRDLPAYEPPKTGLLSVLPSSWLPYAELIRLHSPAGTYYLFLPCILSTLLAAPLCNPIPAPATVAYTTFLFATGALIMRGAGCTVNDLWDRNLDPHVSRTRLRPIARGAITVQQAIPYLGVQLFSGLALLLQFPLECLYYGVPSLLLVGTYPLAKRVTNYPQAVLGLTFSWGAFMGFPALGIDLLSNIPALISAACLYGSCVAWTIVYDMIYAYQDIKDDARVGIKSIALAQEKNSKLFLSVVSSVQAALLAGAGLAVGAGPIYFAGTVGGTAVSAAYMLWKVNLKSVKDCWWWFNKGAWALTGGAITLGLTAEYLAHYLGWYETSPKDKPSKNAT